MQYYKKSEKKKISFLKADRIPHTCDPTELFDAITTCFSEVRGNGRWGGYSMDRNLDDVQGRSVIADGNKYSIANRTYSSNSLFGLRTEVIFESVLVGEVIPENLEEKLFSLGYSSVLKQDQNVFK